MPAYKEAIRVEKRRYLGLLSEKYPTKEAVYERLVNLQARLSMPKGTEHFVSDLHGEFDLFCHILNDCSGVIKEKVEYVFQGRLTKHEQAEFCTLIYYPTEKLELMAEQDIDMAEWYEVQIRRLVDVVKLMSFKYPMRKVRDFLPESYKSLIVELLSSRPETDESQREFFDNLVHAVITTDGVEDFIKTLTNLIKRLAIDHLHIVGDFFDRGGKPDAILDLIMNFHSLDIQWGNHDILWMGAAEGNDVSIAAVVRNSLRYKHTDVLERAYGISIRPLVMLAAKLYPELEPIKAAEVLSSIMMFKLEGQLIDRNPEFKMDHRKLLHYIDKKKGVVNMPGGKTYELLYKNLPTLDPKKPYELSPEEDEVMKGLKANFLASAKLQAHKDFLYQKGSMYLCYNGNLLLHACVPLNEDGTLREVSFKGKSYKGREYYDFCERLCRRAQDGKDPEAVDFMWFLWGGLFSPISGREFHTFEMMFIEDKDTHKEPADPYYKLINKPEICEMLLAEFGLDPKAGHIINGHVPVKVAKGESPVRGGGKALIIDGGICRAYHKKTGISCYTLISNSRGMRLLAHRNIPDVRQALRENTDVESLSETVEITAHRKNMADTDKGQIMKEDIEYLKELLDAYKTGAIKPRPYIH